jgi:hypothetical protein
VSRYFFSFFLLFFLTTEAIAKPRSYPCLIYRLQVPDVPKGEVAFVNGINHKPPRAVKCASLLSSLSGGFNIYVVYNPTDGLFGDLKKCYHELFKFKVTPPVKKLQEKWDYFFKHAKKSERFLQFCHSQGAIQVRNALLHYPEERRKRIIVVAIAPGAYIGQEICCKAYHYISRRDIVPYFDRQGLKKCKNSICFLTPHPDAAFFDHHFLSPTYRAAIEHHLQKFIESGGKVCD